MDEILQRYSRVHNRIMHIFYVWHLSQNIFFCIGNEVVIFHNPFYVPYDNNERQSEIIKI